MFFIPSAYIPKHRRFFLCRRHDGDYWNLYFLLEGVAPASGVLMMIMNDIFAEFADWTVVIFDNVAHGYADAYRKLELVLEKCAYYNLVLRSRFGISRVEFFEYLGEKNTSRLTDERKLAVTSILFPQPPNQTNKMQRFLGFWPSPTSMARRERQRRASAVQWWVGTVCFYVPMGWIVRTFLHVKGITTSHTPRECLRCTFYWSGKCETSRIASRE
jgi:hypothetical protein